MSDGSSGVRLYPGIYRGTVAMNTDPEVRGRLLLTAVDVAGFVPTTWAEPCTPLSGPPGPGMGVYAVPPVGAGVWLMFEHGDVNKPVWLGCRFDTSADPPALRGSRIISPLLSDLTCHAPPASTVPAAPAG